MMEASADKGAVYGRLCRYCRGLDPPDRGDPSLGYVPDARSGD